MSPARPIIYLFLVPALCHITMGAALLAAGHPLVTTSLGDIVQHADANGRAVGLLPWWLAGALLVIAGVMGVYSARAVSKGRSLFACATIVPQQVVLFMSSLTAGRCILRGTFADGTPYDPWFILADQSPHIWLAIFHMVAILHLLRKQP